MPTRLPPATAPPRTDGAGYPSAGAVPYAPWDELEDELTDKWDQGQHVIILGKTGGGKSALGLALLELRARERAGSVVAIGTKPRDATLRATGWPIITQWPPTYAQRQGRRIIFWPRYTKPSQAAATNGQAIRDVLDELMIEGGWTVFIDEMAYLVETLGLRVVLDEYWNGARASHISLAAATQRPYWLSRSAISQGDWGACFRIHDLEDRARAAQVLGDRQRYIPVIGQLRNTPGPSGRHEFLLVRITTDMAVVTELPRRALVTAGK
jgi:energy-coupling factor transporter ATP-binding protein EcfA2